MSNKEMIEEAALRYASKKLNRVIVPYKEVDANVAEYVGFVNGAQWQAERMYSIEEVLNLLDFVNDRLPDLYSRFNPQEELEEWHKFEIKEVSNEQ